MGWVGEEEGMGRGWGEGGLGGREGVIDRGVGGGGGAIECE